MKRYRAFKAKPGEIRLGFGKAPGELPDICFAWGEGTHKWDAKFINYIFCSPRPKIGATPSFEISVIDELQARGYDITTIKFSIQKLKTEETKNA